MKREDNLKRKSAMPEDMLEQRLTDVLHGRKQNVDMYQLGLKETLALAKMESGKIRSKERLSFRQFLLIQGRYIGYKIWAAQALCLFILILIPLSTAGIEFFLFPRYTVYFLCAVSCCSMLCVIPFLGRSSRYKMHELEAVSYMSARRLLLVRLIWIGIGNVVLLAGLFQFMVRYSTLEKGFLLFYLLLLFLFAAAGCLFFLAHVKARYVQVSCTAFVAVLFLSVVWWNRQQADGFFQSGTVAGGSDVTVWVIRCLLLTTLALFCAAQLWYLWQQAAYEEMQIT